MSVKLSGYGELNLLDLKKIGRTLGFACVAAIVGVFVSHWGDIESFFLSMSTLKDHPVVAAVAVALLDAGRRWLTDYQSKYAK